MKWNIKALTLSGIAIFLSAALLFPLFAQAVGEPFTQDKLDTLNRSGEPVLVVIHADWCSTCITQERVLQKLLPQPEFKRIKMLRVDFDQQKSVVESFAVQYQSTFIAFKQGREVARMTAETSSARIVELLRLML